MKISQGEYSEIRYTANTRPDAGESVEQVRRRVAAVVQHLVEREDVVVAAVVGEVGVFDATESDRPLGFGQLLWGQDLRKGRFTFSLIKQTHERHYGADYLSNQCFPADILPALNIPITLGPSSACN